MFIKIKTLSFLLIKYLLFLHAKGGKRWRSWLKHCATSRKVAGTVFNGVSGIIHWHNPSVSTETRGSTHPLTEISTRNIFWG